MAHPLVCRNVLGKLDRYDALQAGRTEPLLRSREPVDGLREQLAGGAGIAQVMTPLTEEADASAVHVEAGAHPVPGLGRPDHRWRLGQRHVADAAEGIVNDFALQRALP